MDGFAAHLLRPYSVPGAHFGDAALPARLLDPGMGIAVARRTIFRPDDNECFGRVADRVAAGNMALLRRELTDAERQEQARLRNAIATGAICNMAMQASPSGTWRCLPTAPPRLHRSQNSTCC